MKKSLMALAALATAGVASAQSSVTVFGVIDLGLQHTSGSLASRSSVSTDGIDGSQLGFRGTEDLGSGLSASFWLEAGFDPDTGSGQATNTNNQFNGWTSGGGLTFNRRSTVSLAGGWGELRLGRDYNTTLRNLGYFDPFYAQGVGGNQMIYSIGFRPTAFRVSNSIAYLYNTNGFWGGQGVYGTVQYYLGENAGTSANPDDGKGYGFRVGYAKGPFDAALAVGRTRYLSGDFKQSNIGGSWDLGFAQLRGQISRDSVGTVDSRGYLIGAMAPVGLWLIRGDYSVYKTDDVGGSPAMKKWALGYVYYMSKRTALYGTYAHLKNSGGANVAFPGAETAVNGSSTGYEFGIRHNF